MKFVIALIILNILAMVGFNISKPTNLIKRASASNDQNYFLPKLMKVN